MRSNRTTITIDKYENVPEPFVAQIEDAPGMVVQGESVIDCLEQLIHSLKAAESHKKRCHE